MAPRLEAHVGERLLSVLAGIVPENRHPHPGVRAEGTIGSSIERRRRSDWSKVAPSRLQVP